MKTLIYSTIIFSSCFLICPNSGEAVCPTLAMGDVQQALQNQNTPISITIAGTKYLLKAYMNNPYTPNDVASIPLAYDSDPHCAYDLNDSHGTLVGFADTMKQ